MHISINLYFVSLYRRVYAYLYIHLYICLLIYEETHVNKAKKLINLFPPETKRNISTELSMSEISTPPCEKEVFTEKQSSQ